MHTHTYTYINRARECNVVACKLCTKRGKSSFLNSLKLFERPGVTDGRDVSLNCERSVMKLIERNFQVQQRE